MSRTLSNAGLLSSAALLATLALGQPASASQFQVIHDFTGAADGAAPGYTLLRDGKKALIGAANQGGAGYGTVFRIKRKSGSWTVKPLYKFTANDGQPGWGVITGQNGSLFVNASYVSVQGGPCGSALELDPAATPTNGAKLVSTLLHTYTKSEDGCPTGNLLRGKGSTLYGVTQNGGAYSWGSVFQLKPSRSGWKETILHSFQGQADGGAPYSELIGDGAGNLYGTASASDINAGTVFELSPSQNGWAFKVLYTFTGGNDGGQPVAALIFDDAGNLYGATASFGTKGGGTIFQMTPSGDIWNFHVLHSLAGTDGPVASLALDKMGTLYGTNFMDGANGYGSVFSLTPVSGKWRYKDLHDFTGGADGGYPGGGVVFDSNGNLFGTAVLGGASGLGVVYEITP
jgi:uncharacterized repeat protein (TIGR03803 family)